MSVTVAMNSVPKPPAGIIEASAMRRPRSSRQPRPTFPGAVGLVPFHKGGRLCGPAFTVRTRPGDNLAIHQALALVQKGDVLVIDGGGDETRALVARS